MAIEKVKREPRQPGGRRASRVEVRTIWLEKGGGVLPVLIKILQARLRNQ
jgi:hypothetical protein